MRNFSVNILKPIPNLFRRISVLRSVSIEGEIVLITGGKQLQVMDFFYEGGLSKGKWVSRRMEGCEYHLDLYDFYRLLANITDT